jgi:mannose-6-phosphate isomerase-like protein (cupin superfamily)
VKLLAFEPTREITHFDSRGATIAGVARAAGEMRVSLLRLDAEGVLGMHPAACPQLFLVVAGTGRVRSGEQERQAIAAGQAALWATGEPHETTTESALTAVVIEADELQLLDQPT